MKIFVKRLFIIYIVMFFALGVACFFPKEQALAQMPFYDLKPAFLRAASAAASACS